MTEHAYKLSASQTSYRVCSGFIAEGGEQEQHTFTCSEAPNMCVMCVIASPPW